MKYNLIICFLMCAGCENKKPQLINLSRIGSIRGSLVGKWGGRDESIPVWKIT